MNRSSRRTGPPRRLIALLTAMVSVVAVGAAGAGPAGATVTGSNNASDIGASMSSFPLNGALLSINYPSPFPTGIGDSPLAGFPTNGPTYAVQTTGNAELADNPNDAGDTGLSKGVSGSGTPFGDGARDYQILRLDVDAAGGNCLAFDFKFLSDEFPEFVGSSYNDTFIAQLDTLGWTVNPETQEVDVTGAPNFAVANGEKIDVNTVGVTGVTEAQAAGTTYDGSTQLLTARTPISGGPHTVYLSTTDLGDNIYDSAVFADNLRLLQLPPDQCEPPFEAELDKTKLVCKGGKCVVPVVCNLPAEIGTPCTNPVQLYQGTAPIKKSTLVAKGTANVAPGDTGKVKLKLTKKGKKLAKKKKKFKGEIKITNAEGTAADTTEVKVKI